MTPRVGGDQHHTVTEGLDTTPDPRDPRSYAQGSGRQTAPPCEISAGMSPGAFVRADRPPRRERMEVAWSAGANRLLPGSRNPTIGPTGWASRQYGRARGRRRMEPNMIGAYGPWA